VLRERIAAGHLKRKNAVRNPKVFVVALVSVGFLGVSSFRAADKDQEDPKYTIKQVMSQAHRRPNKTSPSLSDKVLDGKASKDEQAKLLELYTALGANKPPKGDAGAWKDRATAITIAIKDVMDGKDGSDVDLRKALNCKACHTSHRGK
jgi:hypothetical protein